MKISFWRQMAISLGIVWGVAGMIVGALDSNALYMLLSSIMCGASVHALVRLAARR